jgi:predicted transcriptional regulator
MARPKKEKINNICKSCNTDFKTIPSLIREFCSKSCAQQYKGKDKEWLIKRKKNVFR